MGEYAWSFHNKLLVRGKKVGDPAISPSETRGFPTPSHDGCGFINFLVPTRKVGQSLKAFVASLL